MEATKNVLQWFVTLKRGKRGDAKFTNDSRPAAQRRAISLSTLHGLHGFVEELPDGSYVVDATRYYGG